MIKKSILISILLFFTYISPTLAQISVKGNPIFKDAKAKVSLKPISMPRITTNLLKSAEEEEAKGKLKTLKYGKEFQLSLTPKNSGRWDTLADGRRVWRLALKSSDAYSIGITFSRFKLPEGAKLFLYNNHTDRVLGAYTSKNNKVFNKLAVEPIKGDQITIEYIEPTEVDFSGELEVGALIHDFRDVLKYIYRTSLKSSGSCNVNINCVEGNDWQQEKNSVARITYSKGGATWLGTGALINNSSEDGSPYLLTAWHVLGDSELPPTSIFYFNYESIECDGTFGSLANTISGANLLATTPNLDFALVELTTEPPEEYKPYYAGWDVTGTIAQNTTCIHHPSGDIKKISKDYDQPVTSTYSDGMYALDEDTHWLIEEWDIGTTEGGSSGSPLFDENKRIIGGLTGGDAFCGNSINDYYAKTSNSWADYNTPGQQLKFWLDSDDTGVQTLRGFNPYASFNADFIIESSEFCIGEEITFTDNSYGSPTIYTWEFGEGAEPQTATGKGPHSVAYQSGGEKNIRLTIQKEEESTFVVKTVNAHEPVTPYFSYKVLKNKVTFVNESLNATTIDWNFGDSETSDETNTIEHEYTGSPKKYIVTITGENVCGRESFKKQISTIYDDLVISYPNPITNGNITIDLSTLRFGEIRWDLFDTKGKLMKSGISDTIETLEFNLSGQMKGMYFIRLQIDGTVITKKIILSGNK